MHPIMIPPSNDSRLDRLENCLLSIQLRKGLKNYIDVFKALDPRDHHRITTYLGISPSSSNESGSSYRMRERIQKIIHTLIQELQPSCRYRVKKTGMLSELPERALCLILEFSGKNPALTALVNKKITTTQRASYKPILVAYVQDRRMAPFIGSLTVESINNMSLEDQAANINNIYDDVLHEAREAGIELPIQTPPSQNPVFLDLGPLAEKIQEIKDRDLIVFFEHLLREFGKDVRSKQQTLLSSIPSNAEKASAIRKWMHANRALLAKIKDVQIIDASLKTLPPEIALLVNLNSLNLMRNQLTKLPEEIGCLIHLKRFYLSNNQIKELPFEFSKLVNLQYLYLSRNNLSDLPREMDQFSKLEYVDLSHNELWDLPEKVVKLVNLRNVDLSYNHFIIPPTIPKSKLPKLKELNLSHNPFNDPSIKVNYTGSSSSV